VERSGSFDETPFGAAFAAGATSQAKDVETPVDDVFGPAEPAPTEQVAVSETLAELYRSQGYVDEAKATYEALARVTPQPEKARELIEKAAHLPVSELAPERGVATPVPVDEKPPQETPVLPVESALAGRLAEWATGITVRSTGEPPEFDLGLVLEQLTRPGTSVTSAFLTTTEGLPLASAGDVEGPESESFIGDLTAFWKSAESRSGELETGGPQTLFLEGSKGLGVVCQAGLGQLLLLMARPKAIKGQVRFESRRAAATIERGLS
jgi:predicted regulator of Ras-like GTPase activity (Roadblock/LC7/MglB family)